MKILLDTHVLLWWFLEDPQLSRDARFLIEDIENSVFVSAVSVWEIGWKVKSGRLAQAAQLNEHFLSLLDLVGFRTLPITTAHMIKAVALPGSHKDPFDRILAAQALAEEMVMVSVDPWMTELGASVIW